MDFLIQSCPLLPGSTPFCMCVSKFRIAKWPSLLIGPQQNRNNLCQVVSLFGLNCYSPANENVGWRKGEEEVRVTVTSPHFSRYFNNKPIPLHKALRQWEFWPNKIAFQITPFPYFPLGALNPVGKFVYIIRVEEEEGNPFSLSFSSTPAAKDGGTFVVFIGKFGL